MIRRRLPMRTRRDDGAVLIVVAVFMLVAIAMTAAVVDLGNARAERKEVTLSTDAASLAGAASMDLTGLIPGAYNCAVVPTTTEEQVISFNDFVDEVVDEYLNANGGSIADTADGCVVTVTAENAGFVTVKASDIVEYTFGKAVGQQSQKVSGSSSASVSPSTGGGLRPIGLCQMTGSHGSGPSIEDLLSTVGADGTVPSKPTLQFPIEKVKNESECGGGNGAGNFGQVDFVEGPNGSCHDGSFCDSLENGYFGPVDSSTSGNPGTNFQPFDSQVTALETAGMRFWVPTFSEVTGNGNNTTLTLTYFVEVQAVSHDFTGDPAGRHFTFQVFRIVPFSTNGPPVTADVSAMPPRICAVTASTSGC